MYRTVFVIVIRISVDSYSVTGNSVDEITVIRERMNRRFTLIDQGQSDNYLRVEISRLDEIHENAL